MNWNRPDITEILQQALREDAGSGDITTMSLIPDGSVSRAVLVAKESTVLAGIGCARRVFELADSSVRFRALKKDGALIKKAGMIAEVKGSSQSLLMAERTSLNILQRMSGIAALTRKYVHAVRGLDVKILDTRKTAPCLRPFDKYAVTAGGGYNHRYGLSDGILIKDNHIQAAGGIAKALRLARSGAHHLMKIEVEVSDTAGIRQALESGADVIMLDNMKAGAMKKAVSLIRSRREDVLIEASGNISLENIRTIAETGVDLISIGALTHSAPASDISMKFTDFR